MSALRGHPWLVRALLLLVLLGAAGWGWSGVRGTGTANFLPAWTAVNTVGNSLLFQDTANQIVVHPGASNAADVATFDFSYGSSPNLGVDTSLIVSVASSVVAFAAPTLFLVRARGTYAAPTKHLSGDTLGSIQWQGSAGGLTAVNGPLLSAFALSDGDAASPSYKLDILGNSTLDTIRVGVSATPEIQVTAGFVTLVASLRASGYAMIGSATPLALTAGAIGFTKITASGSAPGAAGAKEEWVCGTGAGTAKKIAYAGTSATAVTIVDNVGTGVTGC